MSETPAMLRLGFPAGGLRRGRQHPLLKGRARRSRQSLLLLDTPEQTCTGSGWLCVSHADPSARVQELLPVSGQPSGPAPHLPEDLQIVAQGEVKSATIALQDGVTAQFRDIRLQRGDAETTVGELVLQGEAGALHALALRLCAELPLRWTGVPGLVLAAVTLGLAEARPVRAGQIAYALPDRANAVVAFAAIARHCLAQFDANMLPVLADRDLEGVHQMRVALRRLRSAIQVFRDILPEAALQPLADELRWLNGPLGDKRDLDVFLHETLKPLQQTGAATEGLARIVQQVEARRGEAQQALSEALQSARCAAWRLGVAQLLATLPGLAAIPPDTDTPDTDTKAGDAPPHLRPDGARGFAAAVLHRRRRKVKKLGRRHATLDTAGLHRLRIHAKRLRYAVEFFRPLFGKRDVRRFLAALTELQDCLGALNDAAMGERLLRDTLGIPPDDPASTAITGWFAGRQRLQLDHLGACWEAFARNKPFWKDALEK